MAVIPDAPRPRVVLDSRRLGEFREVGVMESGVNVLACTFVGRAGVDEMVHERPQRGDRVLRLLEVPENLSPLLVGEDRQQGVDRATARRVGGG